MKCLPRPIEQCIIDWYPKVIHLQRSDMKPTQEIFTEFVVSDSERCEKVLLLGPYIIISKTSICFVVQRCTLFPTTTTKSQYGIKINITIFVT